MALATEEEWETDPELRAMRQEFVASFEERRRALAKLLPELRSGHPGAAQYERALGAAVQVAHKLAGAAESYGFPLLTELAAALEDWAAFAEPAKRASSDAVAATELLAELLGRAQELGKDPKEYAQDARLKAAVARAQKVRPRG